MCWHLEMPIEFSIVMPCLNEARTVGSCIQKARKLIAERQLNAEIIVADNRSSDGSRDIVRALGARLVDVEQRGYGRAVAAGVAAAQGRFIITGDSDDSHDFSEAGRIVDALRAGAEMVIGDRYQGPAIPGATPWTHRHIGVPVLSWIGRVISGAPITDFHCGLRGFTREAILSLDLRMGGMAYTTEMIMAAAMAGMRLTEVPVTHFPDGRGGQPPHLRAIPDGLKTIALMLSFIPRRLRALARPRE